MARLLLLSLLLVSPGLTLHGQTSRTFTRADTLRGATDSPGRAWWDVTFYDLHVAVNPADSSIVGWNAITYRELSPPRRGRPRELQIDLMAPLVVDSMVQHGRSLPFRRDSNAYFATPAPSRPAGGSRTITVYYHGRPRVSPRPPWQGGFTWAQDSLGRPWVVTTDQGLGASVWWPNKDTQADEPDSQRVAITVPPGLVNVSNGRLRSARYHADGSATWEWFVTNPINNYAIAVGAGHYTHFGEVVQGERGPLTMDYWVLDYHLDAARRQFVQARSTIACFERWFGPYPFYEDGFKLVEVPHNGMEHQSAVAYGNRFANGYQGRDGSGTGLGMEWDFIIVHEAAHEWWGNNITTKDLADMWVHESFANYAENLYTECLFGKEAGARYVIGTRRGIRNDRPIVPEAYGVNAQGSGDMYSKGGNMLHTIRQLVGDDERWRGILRGLNADFRHQTVTGRQVEEYLGRATGLDLSAVFDQYLRTTRIPVFEYALDGANLRYRWTDVVPGFAMPVGVRLGGGASLLLRPTEAWQTTTLPGSDPAAFEVDQSYYVVPRPLSP